MLQLCYRSTTQQQVTVERDYLAAQLALRTYALSTRVIYEQGILAIRGSKTTLDFWLNAQFLAKSDRCVHYGFSLAAKMTAARVLRVLNGTKPQIITGHSLGGAIALILALSLDVKDVVTFGCPKVGGAKFIAACKSKGIIHRRYVLGNDIVALLPPQFGYVHYGSAIALPDGRNQWGDGVEDHDMFGYVAALKNRPS